MIFATARGRGIGDVGIETNPATVTRVRRHSTHDNAPSAVSVALGKWTVVGLLALLWEIAARRAWVDDLTLVPLTTSLDRLIELLGTASFRGDVVGTTGAIVVSLVLAVAIGVPLALLVWAHTPIRRAVEGYLAVYYALPSFALYPVLVVIFGVGMPSLVVLGAAFCSVIILSQMLIGLDSIDPSHHQLARSLELSYWSRLRTMLFPGSRPALRAGVRLAGTYALLIVIASEMLVGGGSGLGAFTKQSFNRFAVSDTYAGILMIIVLAVVLNWLASRLTKQTAAPWRTASLGHSIGRGRDASTTTLGRTARRAGQLSVRWVALPVAGVALWALLSLVLSARILPSPGAVGNQVWGDLGDPEFRTGLASTLRSTGAAAALAMLGGMAIAFAVSSSAYLLAVIDNALLVINGIPKILLYPFFLGAFGLGSVTVVSWSAVAGSIPVALCVLPAIANIEEGRMKLSRALRLGHLKHVRSLAMPSVLPQMATGARMGFSLTFIHVIFAEMFGAREGLGVVLANEADFGRLPNMLAVTVVIGVVALIPSAVLVSLEWYTYRRFAPTST